MGTSVSGRVLLVSDAGRVLLVGSLNPAAGGSPIWVAPGGAAEGEETARDSASRELFEETGLRVGAEDLVGPIGTTDGPGLHVEFFLHRLSDDGFFPTAQNPDESERAVWIGFRWWSADELEETEDVFWPRELPELLRTHDTLDAGGGMRRFAWDA